MKESVYLRWNKNIQPPKHPRRSFMNAQDIISSIKTFILDEYVPGEDPAALTDTTPLMIRECLPKTSTDKIDYRTPNS